MNIVTKREKHVREPYVKTRGSGWFWCNLKDGNWIVCYINALWGALVDGKYIRPDNFGDVVGPLIAPETVPE